MPGKVNPTQAEAMLMVAIQVIASDVAVTMGGERGQLRAERLPPDPDQQLPALALIMADMCDHFREFMVEGTQLNQAKLKENIDRSVMMVTALSPVIGYDKAAAISYYAIDNDLTLKQAALAKGVPRGAVRPGGQPPRPHPHPASPTCPSRPQELLTCSPPKGGAGAAAARCRSARRP